MFVCLLDELILGFCYSDLTLETDGFELASATTLVLQANRLTKCASQPNIFNHFDDFVFSKTVNTAYTSTSFQNEESSYE